MRFFPFLGLILLLLLLLLVPRFAFSRHIATPHTRHNAGHHHHQGMKRRGPETVEVAGSRLPDCSHACGSCSPCRLVMVSFVCATLEEAETCPMAYKCFCNNKSFPVP